MWYISCSMYDHWNCAGSVISGLGIGRNSTTRSSPKPTPPPPSVYAYRVGWETLDVTVPPWDSLKSGV